MQAKSKAVRQIRLPRDCMPGGLKRAWAWVDTSDVRGLCAFDPSSDRPKLKWEYTVKFYPVSRIANLDGSYTLKIEMETSPGKHRRFLLPCEVIAVGGRPLRRLLGRHEIVSVPLPVSKEMTARFLKRKDWRAVLDKGTVITVPA